MIRRKRKFKNILIVVLLISIASLSIAYASFSQNLNVTGVTKVLSSGNWDIAFEKILSTDTTGFATATASKTETEKTLTFRCEFVAIGDSCSISASIINKGTINALFTGFEYSIMENGVEEEIKPDIDTDSHFEDETLVINFDKDFSDNKVFVPGDTGKIDVSVTMQDDASIASTRDRYSIVLKYKFVQTEAE